MSKEIWVVPYFGQGHLLPSMELCKQIASRSFQTLIVIPSNLSSSIPAAFRSAPLLGAVEIPADEDMAADPLRPPGADHQDLEMGLENILKDRLSDPDGGRPVFAILDVMMDWTAEIFQKFDVATVGFFTSGACSTAMEYAMWKAHPFDIRPGETRLLPGLPDEMGLTRADAKQRPHARAGHSPPGRRRSGPPHSGSPPPRRRRAGPPRLGQQPSWLDGVNGSEAVMVNTSDDLERPFLDYLATQIGKPVWGVGPLLPEKYWASFGSVIHDREIRSDRRSSVTEDEVVQWLDSKQRGSVLYVSFGSEVGPTLQEYSELREALEESERAFIWVIQEGSGRHGPNRFEEEYFPEGLGERVGSRGLVIRGWAPQLLILSHASTGGFLSHCGWNSTVEALGRGVPILGWPIRGDQFHNAKLVAAHLKVGFVVSEDVSERKKKEEIVKGIESLMGRPEIKQRAELLAAKFKDGFPASSMAALDAFRDMVSQKTA